MATYDHTGSGGVAVNSFAIKSYVHERIGEGGINVGGSALITTSGLLNESHIGAGELLISGSASVSFFSSGGVLPNQDWSLGTEAEFTHERIQNQVNPLATREVGPKEIGDLSEGLDYQTWTIRYSTSSGEITLNDEVQFTQEDIVKIDFTWDVWGYPTIVYVLTDGSLNVRYWDFENGGYLLLGLEPESCTTCFVCLAERRLLETQDYNKIYIAYLKAGRLLTRYYLEQEYGLPRDASSEVNSGISPTIEGMGMTSSYRLQIRVRYNYGGQE